MADGAINIGVFADNHAAFEQGLMMWRRRVPAYIYLSSDGPEPAHPPGPWYTTPARLKCLWNAASEPTDTCAVPPNFEYQHGMAQETCRDISHVTMGLEAMVYAAQTALLQGVDLFGEEENRLHAGIEFAARTSLQALANPVSGSAGQVDPTLCGGTLNYGGTAYTLGWEYAWAELAVRRDWPMPYTAQMLQDIRPTGAELHMNWGTLTGAEIP